MALPELPPRPREENVMVGLSALWLPILLSAVIVFVVSSIIHVATPWHKGDYLQMPNEDKVMDALRPFALQPGDYMVPRPSSAQEIRSPDFVEKMNKGPVLVLTVMPNGSVAMTKSLVLWFLYSAVVGLFAAYVASRALPVDAPSPRVFQLIGVTAFVGSPSRSGRCRSGIAAPGDRRSERRST